MDKDKKSYITEFSEEEKRLNDDAESIDGNFRRDESGNAPEGKAGENQAYYRVSCDNGFATGGICGARLLRSALGWQ